jgi:flagella basal body P-ring formation protein FlgA
MHSMNRSRYIFTIIAVCVLLVQVSAQTLQQVITEKVRAYVSFQAQQRTLDSVRIEFRSLPMIPASIVEPVSCEIVPSSVPIFRNGCTVLVDLVNGQKVVYRIPVSVRVRTYGTVFVTTHQIDRHQTVGPDDLVECFIETTTLAEDVVRQSEQIKEKRTSRIINARTTMKLSMMEAIPLISANDEVSLIVHTGNVRLSTKAIAKDAGSEGSVISVQKVGSHEKLRARVIDSKTVELAVY